MYSDLTRTFDESPSVFHSYSILQFLVIVLLPAVMSAMLVVILYLYVDLQCRTCKQ